MKPFHIKMPSEIIFGEGKIEELPKAISKFGNQALIITGEHSLFKSGNADRIFDMLNNRQIKVTHQKISGEPTVELIDYLCDLYADCNADVM